eukprot:5768576-Amphidinium_carterae.1
MLLKVAVFFAVTIAQLHGAACEEAVPHCPGNCTGHGVCSSMSKCVCRDDWMGANCSQQRLPKHIADARPEGTGKHLAAAA